MVNFKPKVLFITRKFPPSTGGMENFMHGLIMNYPGPKKFIAYGGSQKWLPFIYIWQFFVAIYILIMDKEIDIIHAGDGVMSPMVWVLKSIFNKKASLTTYGKDVNLKFKLYQLLIPPFMKKMDFIFPISIKTKTETINRGICKESNCEIVTPGIYPKEFEYIDNIDSIKKDLLQKYNIDIDNKKILLTVGRLSKRKGVKWFSNSVMPKIKGEYIYLSIGADGTEISGILSWLGVKKISYREEIIKDLKSNNLVESVYLLGKIPFDDLKNFFRIADVFVMPNITVEGDMEGFGMVNIESSLNGTPVVASNIEGIPDAVIEGVTGSLVHEKDINGYIREINKWANRNYSRKDIRESTIKKYSWEFLAGKYFEIFQKIISVRD